jgi:riboflavin kinase/FMN adenylyltransferase
VVNGVGVSEVVVGYDHTFGRDREAGIEELVKMGQEFNFSVSAVHPFRVEGEVVSSTEIRNALMAGDLPRAERFLGYRYGMSGRVVPGDGRGRTIGYPTANIKPLSQKKIVPARGVYVVGVECKGRVFYGMMNIGVRPTVTEGTVQIMEAHLFDMHENIYGETVRVTFLRRLRDERKFSSVQELVAQLGRDKAESLQFAAGLTGAGETGYGKRQFNNI